MIDGDKAPRDTPVDMILYVNAEELQVISNKRLCCKSAKNTRKVVKFICYEAVKATPELNGLLVPMCIRCGGRCYEIKSCGRCGK